MAGPAMAGPAMVGPAMEAQAMERSGSELLRAAEAGQLSEVQRLIEEGFDVSCQDEGRGTSALMLAAVKGHVEVVRALLEAGAPWNALDRKGRCAGDYAAEAHQQEVVDLLLDAAVRAELVLGASGRRNRNEECKSELASNESYLKQRVKYDGDKLIDEESMGVMMAWERPLMEAHAQAICSQGGDILNVGFGMGIVDEAIQRRSPTSHTIVEAHPMVHEKMLKAGWSTRPGVEILFGRWQDVLTPLAGQKQFDGIFFDTYGEDYEDMRDFHNLVLKLLKPNGIYSFFNGLAADNAFFHAVCCHVVELEIARMGLTVQFIPLPLGGIIGSLLPSTGETNSAQQTEDVWKDVARRYWQLDTYYLPVCQFEQQEEDEEEEEKEEKEEEEEETAEEKAEEHSGRSDMHREAETGVLEKI